MIFSNGKNNKKNFPTNVLALDYGEKFTGLARFHRGRDPFPLPYGRLPSQDKSLLLKGLQQIIEEEEVDALLLGIPRLLDGKETSMTKKIREFGETLQEFFSPMAVFYQDETLSTFEAQERMKTSPRYNFKVNLKEIDALAASIILEDFMGRLSRESQEECDAISLS